MPTAGFRSLLPRIPAFMLGSGTVIPVPAFASSAATNRTIVSGMMIRGEIQRLRVENAATGAKETKLVLAKALDSVQTHADDTDQRLRKLSTNLNSLGLTRDPGGNIVMAGATFTVRAGQEIFSLVNNGMQFGLPKVAPNTALIPNGHGQAWVDEIGNTLKITVRYSTGVLKTATIALV